eukprot:3898864-Amphidinium_carterae.1
MTSTQQVRPATYPFNTQTSPEQKEKKEESLQNPVKNVTPLTSPPEQKPLNNFHRSAFRMICNSMPA